MLLGAGWYEWLPGWFGVAATVWIAIVVNRWQRSSAASEFARGRIADRCDTAIDLIHTLRQSIDEYYATARESANAPRLESDRAAVLRDLTHLSSMIGSVRKSCAGKRRKLLRGTELLVRYESFKAEATGSDFYGVWDPTTELTGRMSEIDRTQALLVQDLDRVARRCENL